VNVEAVRLDKIDERFAHKIETRKNLRYSRRDRICCCFTCAFA
jgi:hypothetical protein